MEKEIAAEVDLNGIKVKLKNNPNCRGIVTRVISKKDSILTFVGRNGDHIQLNNTEVVNYDQISVLENGDGKNHPVLILVTIEQFESTFLQVTQAPCPTTVPYFELSSGALKFNMI